MNFFSSDAGVRTHVLVIEPGEYMLESIMALIEVVILEFRDLNVTRLPRAPHGIEVLCEKIGESP